MYITLLSHIAVWCQALANYMADIKCRVLHMSIAGITFFILELNAGHFNLFHTKF